MSIIRTMFKTVDNYATVFEYWFLKKPEEGNKIKKNNIKPGEKIATSIYLTATDTNVNGISPVETGRLKKARSAYKKINDNNFKTMTKKVVTALKEDKTDKELQDALKNLVNLKRIRRLFLTYTSYNTVFDNVSKVTCEQVLAHSALSQTKRNIKNGDQETLLSEYILPYWFFKKPTEGTTPTTPQPKPIEQVIASIYRTGVEEAPKAVKDTGRLAKARRAYKKLNDNIDITIAVKKCIGAITQKNASELTDEYSQLLEISSISQFTSRLGNELPKSSSINIDDILDELEIRKSDNKELRKNIRNNDIEKLKNYIFSYWFFKKTPKEGKEDKPKPIEQIIASIYRTGTTKFSKGAIHGDTRILKARIAYKKLPDNDNIKNNVNIIVEQLDKTESDINAIKDAYNNLAKLKSNAPDFLNINIDDILNELDIRSYGAGTDREIRSDGTKKSYLTTIRNFKKQITLILNQNIDEIDIENLEQTLKNINKFGETKLDGVPLKLWNNLKTFIHDKGVKIQEEFEKYGPNNNNIEHLDKKHQILSIMYGCKNLFSNERLTKFKNALEKVKPK